LEIIIVTRSDFYLENMSYIQKIRDTGRDANPFFRLMGIEVISAEQGHAELRMAVREDMLNGENYLQGGMFTALADEAMVLAIYSLLDDRETLATISETTSYMHGACPGDVLSAEGSVVKRGKRVAFAEGMITKTDGGKLLSRTSASFAVIQGK
jgi:acyl-CoA thioesterase